MASQRRSDGDADAASQRAANCYSLSTAAVGRSTASPANSDSAYSEGADGRGGTPSATAAASCSCCSSAVRLRPLSTAAMPVGPGGDCSPVAGGSASATATGGGDASAGAQHFVRPKRVLLLTKITRLQYERKRYPQLSEQQLIDKLALSGGNYGHLLDRHRHHHRYLETIKRELDKHKIDYKTVQRFQYTEEEIDKADMIFSAGGDGTFLQAASKIKDSSKPVVGINTDPAGSEGYMCLVNKLPETYFAAALDRLLAGNFTWLFRQRIRITVQGPNAWDDPVELHDQQLLAHVVQPPELGREHEESGALHTGTDMNTNRPHPHVIGVNSSQDEPDVDNAQPPALQPAAERFGKPARILPALALNEVFVGESVSSRVSYYEMCVDGGRWAKYKSSGLTVCTGTGSTSWYFNINRLAPTCVNDLINILSSETGLRLPVGDVELSRRVAARYNRMLVYDPCEPKMAFVMRDPIVNSTFHCAEPRGFANHIEVRSRCSDAHLAIDGGMSFSFNTGSTATFEIRPEDALRTIVFR